MDEADAPEESVAFTVWEPEDEFGTVNVADQVPLELTVLLLLPMLTLVPLKVTPELWLIVAALVKPVPEMVTDVPTGPLVTESVMADCTVKVAVADTPAESVAFTVWEPEDEFGTVNVADQVPFEATVWLLPMLTFVPLKVTPELLLIVFPFVKPEPEIVTDVPTGPVVDNRVTPGVAPACASLEYDELPAAFTASTVK
jgi:hypothetical protein